MALNFLPTELLEIIITHVMPEGFESMAMTCKKFLALCIPFIEEHNKFRSRFHHFEYSTTRRDPSPAIRTAFDLITRIADEPRIANYIRSADFEFDSLSTYAQCRESSHGSDAVTKLFANSPYLEQAGLDWQIYYDDIEKDFRTIRYSQNAAAFLLTLLPNVENLCLPKRWKPNAATDKLIDVVARKARQSPYERPSLARVTRFCVSALLGSRKCLDLNWTSAFLALPCIQSFRGSDCIAMDDGISKNPYSGFATTLETAKFMSCCIDEVSIAEFLKRSPRLKTLWYKHSIKRNVGPQDWDICKFVTAIEREAGSHLEKLSVFMNLRELGGSIHSDRVSMSGFHRLQKLEIPLEIVICNINPAVACQAATTLGESSMVEDGTMDRHEPNLEKAFIEDLVPASISQLSLISTGTDDHAKALHMMFRDFAVRNKLPALERIYLSLPVIASNAYKEQYASLLAETEKAGVVLERRSWRKLLL